MLRRVAVVVGMALVACGQPKGTLGALDGEVRFEPTPFETRRERTLIISNVGDAPLQVAAALDETTDFSVADDTLIIAPRGSMPLLISFRPSRLGARTAMLTLKSDGGSAQVALFGSGTGAQLDVAEEIILNPTQLVPGEGPAHAKGTLILRNTGTRGAPLRITAITPNAPSLCIGDQCAGISQTIRPFEVINVPLEATLSEAGSISWSVTIASDDPAAPSQIITVRAVAEPVELCNFDVPASFALDHSAEALRLQHRGSLRCLVREITFTEAGGGSSVLVRTPNLPVLVDSLTPLVITLRTMELAARPLGVLHIVTAGAPVIDIPVFLNAVTGLTVTPSEASFGSAGCANTRRTFSVYNTSSSPVVIESVAVQGSTAFTLTVPYTLPVTIESGATAPVQITATWQPSLTGIDEAAIVIATQSVGAYYVSLRGQSMNRPPTTDSFRVYQRPELDLLFIVDTSPSFAAQRPAIRTSLSWLLTVGAQVCVDMRVAFAPAEGAAGASVDFGHSDAGEVWTSWKSEDFVNRAMSAFDALPASSETEACLGPASQLLPDAGVRSDALLSVSCFTDALEHTPNPVPTMTALKQAFPRLTWNAMTGVASSTCAVEAIDDGVHEQLVSSTAGTHFDICTASWEQWGSTGECVQLTYYLNNRPDGAVTILKDGVVVPNAQAHFDVVFNAVVFEPDVLLGGELIEVTYVPACIP